MEQNELRTFFQVGDLKNCCCVKAPLQEGWVLQFDSTHYKRPIVLHSKHNDRARVFASIDTAVRVAQQIGFRAVGVVL